MKRQAFHHTKMDELMRLLDLPRWGAVGVLESLWALTAREAPRGDIGKLSDERIALGIGWRGRKNVKPSEEAVRLVQALVEAEWLEVNAECRIVVHDWAEHCDNSVKKWLQRNNLSFICPDMSRQVEKCLPRARALPVPEPVPEPYTPPKTPPPPNPDQAAPPSAPLFDLSSEKMKPRKPTKKQPI